MDFSREIYCPEMAETGLRCIAQDTEGYCNADSGGRYCSMNEKAPKECPVGEYRSIIKAMLSGEWRCDTCDLNPETSVTGRHCGDESGIPCANWQPKEGGE